MIFHRKPPYTTKDTASYVNQISELQKQRERAMQLSIVSKTDEHKLKYVQEIDLITGNIESANLVLNFMYEAIEQFNKGNKGG